MLRDTAASGLKGRPRLSHEASGQRTRRLTTCVGPSKVHMMRAMVAHVQVAVTHRTPAVLDIQRHPFEGCPRGPTIRPGRSILVLQCVDVSYREPTITSSRHAV